MRMSDAPISILGCAGPRLKARQRALKANSEAPDRFRGQCPVRGVAEALSARGVKTARGGRMDRSAGERHPAEGMTTAGVIRGSAAVSPVRGIAAHKGPGRPLVGAFR
jgi:hypothetical protein